MTSNPPGRIVTKPLADGFARVQILSEEAARAKSIVPVPTVWGRREGRPVYDRLPGVSEAYKREYFGEEGRGLVYIDPQFGSPVGSGSVQVGSWSEDEHVLIIESGTITWAKGVIETETIAIDLRLIDGNEGIVQDGEYQVGYYLDYVQPTATSVDIFEVENSLLGASVSEYAASSTIRNRPVSAMFSEIDSRSWTPTQFSQAGPYELGESVAIDFTAPVKTGSFSLESESVRQSTATCALYRSDDGIVWFLEDNRKSVDGSWFLLPGSLNRHRYWRFFFWDGAVSVSSVRYTGEAYFQNVKPIGPVSSVEPFIEGKFDQIDRPHIVLATIVVKDKKIVSITDRRKISSIKYEPVASWLTDFQDSTLKKIFSAVESYHLEYLSPTSGAVGIYEELLNAGFVLGDEVGSTGVTFPDEIALKEGSAVISNADILSDPLEQALVVDPNAFTIIGEGIPFYRSSSSISPLAIILLGEAIEDSDLMTRSLVDSAFTVELDNGIYS